MPEKRRGPALQPGTATHEVLLEGDPRWKVEVTLAVAHGQLVVTGLAVTPADPAVVPEGGVTSRLLRQVKVGEFVEQVRALARGEYPEKGLVRFSSSYDTIPDLAATAPSRPGRAGRDDEHYLPWVAWYAEKLAAGSRSPITEIAREQGVPRGLVRDRIHQARLRGLFTKPERAVVGRAGGELTDKARALIAKLEEEPG